MRVDRPSNLEQGRYDDSFDNPDLVLGFFFSVVKTSHTCVFLIDGVEDYRSDLNGDLKRRDLTRLSVGPDMIPIRSRCITQEDFFFIDIK